MKRVLIFAVVAIFAIILLPQIVSAEQEGDFTYTISGSEATITGYTGSGGDVAIPDKLGEYTVTSIGNNAFQHCTSLTAITLPETIKDIGYDAFYGCNKLATIDLPNSIVTIGGSAFYDCSKLTEIVIPEEVTSLEDGLFYNCTSLESVTVPSNVTSLGNDVFYNCKELINVNIPNGVTTISDHAFFGCNSLKSILIPDSVSRIEDYAFCGCSSITDITIPSSVTSIGDEAFGGCGLVNVIIPNSIKTIQYCTFEGCSNLTSITIPDSVTSIGYGAFVRCRKLSSISLPSSVTSIGDNVFNDCTNLESINIPSGVTSIGYRTFGNCSKLSSLTIPDGVTIINGGLFENCSDLASVNIPSGVTFIDERAFCGCSSLTDIQIPDKVSIISDDTFHGCSKLTNITLPSGITKIGSSAFYGCEKLAEINIPDSVKTIEFDAFQSCNSLKSVSIPSSVTNMGEGVFAGCDGMTSVFIHCNLPLIWDYMFCDCTHLRAAYFYGNAPILRDQVFDNSASDFTVYHREVDTGYTNPWYGYQTAVFNPDVTCTLSFDLHGSTGTPPDTQSVFQGVKALSPENPIRPGYSFSGWYKEEGCQNKWDFETDTVTEDMTLYAKWLEVLYPITYSLGGGTVASANPTSYTIGNDAITLNNPTRTGYTFAGWSGTDITGTVPSVIIPKGSSGARNYTALWTPISYTITYDLDGGTKVYNDPESYTIEDPIITIHDPVKQGYAFEGWTGTGLTQKETVVRIQHGSSGDRTYKANWVVTDISVYLSSMTATNGTLYTTDTSKPYPGFDERSREYALLLNSGYTSSTISVTTLNPEASVAINGNPGKTITLSLGGTASIQVTLGTFTRTYTVTAQACSHDADLSRIGTSSGGSFLTPSFDPSILNYTVTPAGVDTSAYVDAAPHDPFANMKINGADSSVWLDLNNPSYPKAAVIEVTASDGVTKKTYTVTISSQRSSADISGMSFRYDVGTLYPEFNPNITSYYVKYLDNRIIPTLVLSPCDYTSTIKVNGKVQSGIIDGSQFDPVYACQIANVGNKPVKIVIEVTSGDGKMKKTYTIQLFDKNVKLGTPSLTAKATDYKSVSLSWSPIANATAYEVYRKTGSAYSLIATVNGVNYTDAGLPAGVTYSYKVRAYWTPFSTTLYSGYSSIKSAKPVWPAPSLKAASTTFSSATLNWNAIPGASGYEVYRCEKANGVYTLLNGNVASTTYTDGGLTPGNTYYYKVRAFDTAKLYGPFSSYKYAKPVWPKLTLSMLSATSGSISLKWNAIPGVQGYEVYRCDTSSKGLYVLTGSGITGATYTDTGLTAGNTYYYKIRAYGIVNGITIYGPYCSIKTAKTLK